MEELLQQSKEQLLNPLSEARRKLLIILNLVYCVLTPYFLLSEWLATGRLTNEPILLAVYGSAIFLNLTSAVYNFLIYRRLKGRPLPFRLPSQDLSIYHHHRKLDIVFGYISICPILFMSFLNMTGFGNPFGDAILTDFALAHSLMIVVVIILGRFALCVWFIVVMGVLSYNVSQRGWNYEYHYSTPTEANRYLEGLKANEPWAIERKLELEKARLRPPEISRYFNTWTVFLVVAFLTAYFFSGITVDILKIIPSVVSNIETALEDTKKMEQEQKIYEEKTNTFINLAHETKTPLTLINNYLDEYISKKGTQGSEELQVLKSNIEKLTSDMVNFFDLERLDRGFDIYDHDRLINFSKILSNKVVLFKNLADKKGISVESDIHADLFVIANPSAIERIVNNLIENAIKYTQSNGKVHVSLYQKGGNVEFCVKDTGTGIPESLRQRIFEPYFQLATPKKVSDGMGLGLSIVSKIVTNVGGVIKLTSEEGKGTEICVSIPQFVPPTGTEEEQYKVSQTTSLYIGLATVNDAVGDTGKPFLLVIEDNLTMLSYLVEKLRSRYNVYAAKSASEAFEKLSAAPRLDLIIADVMMEPMDGFEFVQQLYKNEAYEHIPVIFLTAKTTSVDKIRGLSLGAIDYIEKPFLISQLLHKIDSILVNFKKQQVALIKKASQLLSPEYERRGQSLTDQVNSDYYDNCRKYGLTKREIEIVNLLITGQPYKIIGDALAISINTVAKHISNIFHKVNVSNKVELIHKLHETSNQPPPPNLNQ